MREYLRHEFGQGMNGVELRCGVSGDIFEVSSPPFHDLLSLGLILCGRANDDCYLLTTVFCPRTYEAFYSDVCIVIILCILCGSLHAYRVPANWIFYLLFLLSLGSTLFFLLDSTVWRHKPIGMPLFSGISDPHPLCPSLLGRAEVCS
jgi:hypothetical protein